MAVLLKSPSTARGAPAFGKSGGRGRDACSPPFAPVPPAVCGARTGAPTSSRPPATLVQPGLEAGGRRGGSSLPSSAPPSRSLPASPRRILPPLLSSPCLSLTLAPRCAAVGAAPGDPTRAPPPRGCAEKGPSPRIALLLLLLIILLLYHLLLLLFPPPTASSQRPGAGGGGARR